MSKKKRVLAIGFSPAEFERIDGALDRRFHEFDRFPSAAGAIELVDHLTFDLLLARHPLRDIATGDFLARVRGGKSRSRASAIALITDEKSRAEAEVLVAGGANRVLTFDSPTDQLESVLMQLIYVAPRQRVRFMAQIAAHSPAGPDRELSGAGVIVGQAYNSSITGLLIASRRKLENGTQIDFQLALPVMGPPVRGRGEVVRHTRPEIEKIDGMGIRFLSFVGDSLRKYQEFLSRSG